VPLRDLSSQLEAAGLAETTHTDTLERLSGYLELRAKWSRTHNIAGPRARANPVLVDLVDAFAVTRVLDPALGLVDVGAGSGVPGLVVAMLRPQLDVLLVEPLAKRVAFLRTATHSLGLDRVRVERARWPVALDADVQVVSRAVVSPDDWPELALSGGAQVKAFIRMLARKRPSLDGTGHTLLAHVDYRLEGDRRVERWGATRSGTS
jgi:16S rRNA (guanine527-N7)-methyltransferase